MSDVLNKIAARENIALKSFKKLQGGNTNNVYAVEGTDQECVIKINAHPQAEKRFETEARGLELLRKAHAFYIPKVLGRGNLEKHHYLLLEKIQGGKEDHNFWEKFGVSLAKQHQIENPTFGLDYDNFIGLLPQKNQSTTSNPVEFYIQYRLKPLFETAEMNGYTFSRSRLQKLYSTLEQLIPDQKPALIHGDLWRSNYLATSSGEPVLIDPAVSFAPREMDLAMMKLFGGFPEEVFSAYNETYPLTEGWKERIGIWQLYYLLVHLNIFGFGYLRQVNDVIDRYLS